MEPKKRMPGGVKVSLSGWEKWKMPEWDRPPHGRLIAWVKHELEYRKRPFILLDAFGSAHEPVEIVNARILHVKGIPLEKRLTVVYVYSSLGLLYSSWGELLFIDVKPRLPYFGEFRFRVWLAKTREKIFPRRNK